MAAPLLACEDLRLDVDGVPAVDGLTLVSREGAERVVVVGAPTALFEATCGVRRAARGSVRVRGVASDRALREGIVAGAPRDPPLPSDWSAATYVEWSARLRGESAAAARVSAAAALDRIGLGEERRTPLGRALPATRRATSVAAALATGAPLVALEDPTASLDDASAHALAALVVRALEGRAWVLFAAQAVADSALAVSCDELLLHDPGNVVARGTPSELAARARRYVVDVAGDAKAFEAALRRRARAVDAQPVAGACARFHVELAEGDTTRAVLDAAASAGAVVVELRPIARPFA